MIIHGLNIYSGRQMIKKNTLKKDIKRDSYDGIRKPEQEKHELLGCMSRRITEEHRLLNEVNDSTIKIISCSYHY